MPIENKIRSVGNKSVIYPWMRRYVVIGPYNRHVRKDMAEKALTRTLAIALTQALRARTQASAAAAAARQRARQRGGKPT